MEDTRHYFDGQRLVRIWVNDREFFMVGMGGVTKIEIHMEPGMYCAIPHTAVYRGHYLVAKYCIHHIKGVSNYATSDVDTDDD